MSYNLDALDNYAATIGVEKTLKMVEFAVTYIAQREQQLKEALLNAELQQAADYAHKAVGSVRLYGSPQLEQLLCQVRDQDYAQENSAALQRELSAEFALADQALKSWIKQQSK